MPLFNPPQIPTDDDLAATLTEREREVASLLARGLSNRAIASELVIGVRTVETHVGHILRKLALPNRAKARTWARAHGLDATRNP